MSVFDNINPFKKKQDFLNPAFDKGPHTVEDGTPNPDHSDLNLGYPSPEPISALHDTQPLNDQRMTMPLGENIRQSKMAAYYDHQDKPEDIPNPLQKDLDLISAKLDYLKQSLDTINQRLVNLEHITRDEINKKKW